MKFCDDHWNMLREAIKKKGLGPFIRKSGEAVIAQVERELKDEYTIPDPLMSCHNRIMEVALPNAPHLLFANKESGENECALCDVKVSGQKREIPRDDLDVNWIDGCTTECRDFFIKEGFLKEN